MRVSFREWESIVYVDMSVIEDFRGDGDAILHDGGENIQAIENDEVGSHSDDENEESDEEGNDMTVSDNGDDEGKDQSDDDNWDHRFRGKCFLRR